MLVNHEFSEAVLNQHEDTKSCYDFSYLDFYKPFVPIIPEFQQTAFKLLVDKVEHLEKQIAELKDIVDKLAVTSEE